MEYFLVIICVILVVLSFCQAYYVLWGYDQKKIGKLEDEFSQKAPECGDDMMNAVLCGIVKKHVLKNDSVKFDGDIARSRYFEFVEGSSLFGRIMEYKGSRYYG